MYRPAITASETKYSLPEELREQLAQQLFSSQLDELNGLGDRLGYLGAQPSDAAISSQLTQLEQRCAKIIAALSWNAVASCQRAWTQVALVQGPEDAFAPALILACLEVNRQGVDAWLQTLSPQIHAELRARRFEQLRHSARRAGSSHPKAMERRS